MSNFYKSIFIVRTPFQAWLCDRLIERLGKDFYDILYITYNNSEEDVFYFNRLSSGAETSSYVYVEPSFFDVFNHIKTFFRVRSWFNKRCYDCVYVASINSYVINSLAFSFSESELFSFDDGVANLVESGPYFKSDFSLRSRFYRAIFCAQPVERFRAKISRHYTIYPGFANIVEEERLSYLDGWKTDRKVGVSHPKSVKVKRYFLGAPFHEVMNRSEIDSMLRLLGDLRLDGYLIHPREIDPLPVDAPLINKGGRIAEDVIVDCSEGSVVELYGYFSTVMINLKDYAERKVVFVSKRSSSYELLDLAERSGCEVIFV